MNAIIKHEALPRIPVNDVYTGDWDQYLSFAETEGRHPLGALQEFVDRLEEKGYAAESINKKIKAVRHRIRWMVRYNKLRLTEEQRHQLEQSLLDVKLRKKVRKLVNPDTIPDYEEIRKLLSEGWSYDKTTVLMIEFLAATGARLSEMVLARRDKSNCKRINDYWDIRIKGKGHKERWVKVSSDLVDRIDQHHGSQNRDWFFQRKDGHHYSPKAVGGRIHLLGAVVLGRRDIGAHRFRHAYATQKLREGADLVALSRYLGHASVSITGDLYAHTAFHTADEAEPKALRSPTEGPRPFQGSPPDTSRAF